MPHKASYMVENLSFNSAARGMLIHRNSACERGHSDSVEGTFKMTRAKFRSTQEIIVRNVLYKKKIFNHSMKMKQNISKNYVRDKIRNT